MNCSEFSRWLDDGKPPRKEAAFLAHARSCASCAQLLRASLDVETALALPAGTPAPDFADRVMRSVRQAGTEHVVMGMLPDLSPFPWWVRAAAQPAVALAFTLAALLLWGGRDVWVFALGLPLLWDQAERRVMLPMETLLAHFANPWTLAALLLPVLVAFFWVSWLLFGWSSRLFSRSDPTRELRPL